MFAPDLYIARRETLRKSVGSGIILLNGNEESPMNYADNPYPFRQDSTFLYFFGLNGPGLTGILDCDRGEDWVFGNDLTVEDFVWMGPQPSLAEQSLRAGVKKTGTRLDLDAALDRAQAQGRTIHFLPPYRAENKLKLMGWLGLPAAALGAKASLALTRAVAEQRNHKGPEEIAEIRQAVDLSVDMHRTAMRLARPGVREAEIAAAVQSVAEAAGGRIAFPIIATINGQTLHIHSHANTLPSGRMFLLDIGAETALGYAGDLSSTMPIDPRFTPRQKDLYELVLASHNRAIEMLRPGIPFKEVYLESARVIVRGLQALGLMKGDVAEAVDQGAHALFFPCGLGHLMGLDVHDMEDLGEVQVGWAGNPKPTQFGIKSLRLGRKLEPGFVLTIEPGIYFIPELIDQWRGKKLHDDFINFEKVEAYKGFGGIRNEENFLITETGFERLGQPKPMSVAEVEAEHAKTLPL